MTNKKTIPEIVSSATDEKIKTAPQTIANALQSLPLEQREQVVRDLYGIEKEEAKWTATIQHVHGYPVTTPEMEEDESFLDQKLVEMEQELTRIKTQNRWTLNLAALELAEQQNLEFTRGRLLRLKFLRCDRFHVAKAVRRMIRYFDWKLELYGQDAFAREITMNDLTKEDQVMLKKGYVQRLPVRDRAGRPIICSMLVGQTYDSPESAVSRSLDVSALLAISSLMPYSTVLFAGTDLLLPGIGMR